MERSEYPAMLPVVAPSHAIEILNDRVAHISRMNTEVAEWLAERRRLEEVYAASLRKLARRSIQGVDLGIFSVPWNQLASATESQAESHASLATKIETDVERPLRDFAKSNREMQAMSNMQGNAVALAKDVDQAQSKLDKLQGRGERADSTKVASANQELDHAHAQWESQAPFVFENLQAVDEIRLSHLRDVLTQLQTHEIDQVEKDRVSAEQCLNVLLNVEIADEIKTFSLKAVASKPRVERFPRAVPAAAAAAAASSPSSTPSGEANRPALNPTLSQISANDDASRSDSLQDDEKKKSKGLKRLSTVLGRKKDKPAKTQLEPMAEVSESKSRGGLFSRKKKDAINLDTVAENSAASPPQRPYSPLRIGSEAFESSQLEGQETRRANGTASSSTGAAAILSNGGHQNDLAGLAVDQPAPTTKLEPLSREDSEGFSVPQAARAVDPITQAERDAANAVSEPGSSVTDGTGQALDNAPQYNVRIQDSPVAAEPPRDADAAFANVASQLQMQAPPTQQRRAGTVRGRRDGRNSTFIGVNPLPLPGSNVAHSESMEQQSQATSFTPPSQTPDFTAPAAPSSTAREAFAPVAATTSQSDAATLSVPAPFNPTASTSSSVFSTSTIPANDVSPMKAVPRALTADTTGGDNSSIRSGRSLASNTSQAHRHPELASSGLNASIIETVSARFENGHNVSSSLMGEIALAYNPSSSSTPVALDVIRLEHYDSLEKVAPNPAFVLQVAGGKDGEFNVNLAAIAKPQVAFRYQARLADGSAQAPLLASAVYKMEPTQTSAIVSLSLNPAFAAQSVKLNNVVMVLTLEGGKTTSCQSKPPGIFSREKNAIYWQLGDVALTQGAAPTKLLARFATESQAVAGSIDARWEISGEQSTNLGSGLAVTSQTMHNGDGTDPFADESGQSSGFKPVHTVKKLVSGTYSAK